MRVWIAALCALLVAAADPARAQPLPDSLRTAGVTQAEWNDIRVEVQHQARRAGVANAALLAAAERTGANLARSGRYDAAALRDVIIGQLESHARTIQELQDRLGILSRTDDPQIARFLTEARIAIDEGQLDDADRLLAQAEESDLGAVAMAEARAERARARIADAIAERGRLGPIEGGGAEPQVRDAIEAYETTLRSLDRSLSPRDWARTQFNLGVAYAILAQSGEDEARARAIAALTAAALGFEELEDEPGTVRTLRLIAALRVGPIH